MKICFVLGHFYPHIGGGETMFKEYATRLVEAGCEVKVITSNSGGITGKAIYDGVETHHFNWRSAFGHPIPNPRDLYPFVQWADLVHTAILPAAPVALHVARKCNKPCIATIYEALGKKWWWIEKNMVKASLFYLFEQFVITRPYSLCHTISHATERDLQKYSLRKQQAVTIYPGIKKSIEEYVKNRQPHAGEPAAKKFLFFGRPGKTKGLFVLFEAIREAEKALPEEFSYTFILANDPVRDKHRLLDLIEKHGLTERIEILPPLPEGQLVAAIESAYCVIIPSITEGFGYSTAEACALGKPVIVSDGGSLPEVASGRVLFFQNRNSQDLAQKLLLAAKGEFQSIPKKEFGWDESTRQLLRLYEDLLQGKAATEFLEPVAD
jgi:glycosyltransferase involved in cell wall biosynthesis